MEDIEDKIRPEEPEDFDFRAWAETTGLTRASVKLLQKEDLLEPKVL